MKLKLDQNILTLIALLFIAVVIIALSLPEKLQISNPIPTTAPDWIMTNASSRTFSSQGLIKSEIITPQIQHFIQNDVALLDTPFFVLYGSNRVPWHISAAHAKAYQGKNEKIFLWGNVVVQQMPGKGSNETKLVTNSITYFPNSSEAVTNQPVVITQPGSIVHSVGLIANLKTSDIRFLSQTKVQFNEDKSQ